MPAPTSTFSDLYQKMEKQLSSVIDDDRRDPSVHCMYCYREERVVDFGDLKRGDHIRMGGRNFMFNFKGNQVTFYKHHAIFKGVVQKVDKHRCIATLIHFYTKSFDDTVQIRETDQIIDLQYDELYKVRYAHGTHSPDEIIQRATRLTNSDKSYSVMTCNCEHFCHLCCVGNAESYQVKDAYTVLKQIGAGYLSFLGGHFGTAFANIIILTLDNLATANTVSIAAPWGILSLMAVMHLIYCLYCHYCLNRDMALGQVCARCCKKEKNDLWMRFIVYCATQAGGVILLSVITAAVASNGIIFGTTAVIASIVIALMWGIPRLKNALCSPFKGKKINVGSTDNISVGDVISFRYMLKMHDGIVSKVERINLQKAKVSVIHYSMPSVFGRRVVQEETLEFDLARDKVMGHQYSGNGVHPPEIVVQRARQRLGETKFGVLSNRSCHFCHWAKVNEDIEDAPEEIAVPTRDLLYERSIEMGEYISGLRQIDVDYRSNRKLATKTIVKVCARIPQEVKEGSIIQFKYGSFKRWHYAVTTDVQHTTEPSLKLFVTVVHRKEGSRPCEEGFEFDLRHDDIYIYRYHPLFCYSREDVVRRARERIGKGNYQDIKRSSFQLTKEIVEKDRDELVTNFDMINKGDVIIFYYWSLKHAAVVINVGESSSKANDIAPVKMIHYALDTLFSRRMIIQEEIIMDLSRDHVYRRNYKEVTYQANEVVQRAESRVGERRFSINGNTSWDLVHWAKVVQTPAIVNKSFDDADAATSRVPDGEERLVLLPEVGKAREYFRKVRVLSWNDLHSGIIIEYLYYWILHQSILVDVDKDAEQITVIHYGTNTIFSTRTIMQETFNVDPKRDALWMYICNPDMCNPRESIVDKAYERLGEKKWANNNRSWDFCKACVLKQ